MDDGEAGTCTKIDCEKKHQFLSTASNFREPSNLWQVEGAVLKQNACVNADWRLLATVPHAL